MRRLSIFAASSMLAVSLLVAPDMAAQTRSTNNGSSRSSTGSSAASGTSRSAGTSSSQVRSGGSTTSGSASRSTTGTSSSQVRSGSSTAGSSSASRSGSNTVVRSSGSTAGTGSSARSSNTAVNPVSPQTSAASGAARSNVSRSGLGVNPVASSSPVSETYRDAGYNYRYPGDMRVDDRHNMYRIPPRQRDPLPWDRPGFFYGDVPHYYGYRIVALPPQYRRISHWGIDYYFCNGIYYRPFGGAYVVCRPPFGTPLEVAIERAVLRSIRFAYYCDTYRTFERTFDYYNTIARQNLIIAQQNARIIAQNANYAINGTRALSAYELANKLGLVQSYAYANSEYYYQDGVFYTISASGQYTTIVPPAGALVTSLPDDYEVIVMNGIEYYMVDNTVFRTTVFEGEPYLEVLGQMYGSLYSQYNVYR